MSPDAHLKRLLGVEPEDVLEELPIELGQI